MGSSVKNNLHPSLLFSTQIWVVCCFLQVALSMNRVTPKMKNSGIPELWNGGKSTQILKGRIKFKFMQVHFSHTYLKVHIRDSNPPVLARNLLLSANIFGVKKNMEFFRVKP